jgi:multidrug transporter EmrE-like cation transporter
MKFLILSVLFEIMWVNLLKVSATAQDKFVLLFLMVVTMLLSLYFLSLAVKTTPLTFSYAVWTSSGLVGTALIQHFYFHNSLSVQSWLAVLLIAAGICLFERSEVSS